MPVVLLFIGFASILGQVVLLRELAVAFFGSELIYLLAIAFWLIFTGLGALVSRGTAPATTNQLIVSIAALGFMLPLEVIFARAVRLIFGATPGAFMPLEHQIVAMAVTLAPAGLLLGRLFVVAARRYTAQGGTFATAYGIESFGGVLGGLASTFLLAGNLPAFPTAILCSTITLVVGFIVSRSHFGSRLFFAFTALGFLGMLVIGSGQLDRATLRWQFPGLLENRDSPYGRLTLTSHGGQIAMFENGALSFETQGTEPEEIAHLALLQHPAPQHILLLGGGISGTIREILKHHPESIDYVELDPHLVKLARKHLPREILSSLNDPRVHLVVSDGRKFMRTTKERYDMILVDMPEPTSGQTNRYYTREFFSECRRRLRTGGRVAFRLPSAEQYWTPGLARRNGSIYRALESVFSDIIVLPGSVNIFIAAEDTLARDPEVSARRFLARDIQARLVRPSYIHYLYTNDRFAQIESILGQETAPANSDLKPICYQLTLLVWLSRFHRPLAEFQASIGGWIWWLLLPLGAVFWVLRRRAVASKVLLVAMAGFAGMVIEFAVLLRFQTASGVLFRDVGLLLAGFMAGLAISPIPGRWAARISRGGILLVLSFAVLCALSALLFYWEGTRYTLVGMLWLGFVGCGVGSLFCYAAEKRKEKGAPLYAADLFGGSLGGLIGSVILLPSLGLDTTALWVGSVAVLGVLLARSS
jgi:spermidine synthase